MNILVKRTKKTSDGIFGVMQVADFICYTCENLEKSILADTYVVNFTLSKRFQSLMPHIIVPYRDVLAGGDAGIRIHSANYPKQLEGCIAVGDRIEGDMVCDSRETFAKLFHIINNNPDIKITITEDYPKEV